MSTTLLSDHEALLAAARDARENAYAPYSKFTVGAALDTGEGQVFLGCNVENASYGLTMCAERVAIGAAVTAGYRDFATIAVAGPDGVVTSPCGACRQVLAEFNPDMTVVYTTPDGPVTTTVAELLPHSFGPLV
jgi:cytidine deaminase